MAFLQRFNILLKTEARYILPETGALLLRVQDIARYVADVAKRGSWKICGQRGKASGCRREAWLCPQNMAFQPRSESPETMAPAYESCCDQEPAESAERPLIFKHEKRRIMAENRAKRRLAHALHLWHISAKLTEKGNRRSPRPGAGLQTSGWLLL